MLEFLQNYLDGVLLKILKMSLFYSFTTSVLLIFLSVHQAYSYTYEIKYFETRVDHFDFTKKVTFKLRYLINDTYWGTERNSPIFFYAGNEGDITDFADNTGFIWENAPEFKALILFAEHRYYGESLPFGEKSTETENVGYLSSSQALMDYVELLADLKKNKHDHPVVVFGGSYGGMLAAWMRMKYPATVVGAIASSAPIWQFTGMAPCYTFNRINTQVFTAESTHCSSNVRKSWKVINHLANTATGRNWLTKSWNLCDPLESKSNVTDLKDYLIDLYGNLAMVNYPYPANFLAPLPGYPVKEFCSYLTEDLDGKDLLTALFGGVSVYFNYTGTETCLNYSSAYTQGLDDSLWDYQACTEMVMPFCADGVNDMFEPSPWNLEEYVESCRYYYQAEARANIVKYIYGGKHISAASNIIFSNGKLDPWSGGGVLYNVSDTAVAIVMEGAAHHLDLRASNSADPDSVVAARNYYRQVISQWIKS